VRFGISTLLYHAQPLGREHLAEIAAHGFESIELFALRTHFDYHDAAAIDRLAGWLDASRLTLHAVHAPIADAFRQDRWEGNVSIATSETLARTRALREAEAALALARRIPYGMLVVHLGVPLSQGPAPTDNQADAARRSIERLAELSEAAGVKLALEVIPNAISSPGVLAQLLDEDLDLPQVGVCLDTGHAHILGDPVEAVEALSGQIITTHVNDNHGTEDEHLCPYEGTIDWDAVLMSLQKVGYEGVLMFELGNTSTPAAVLAKARSARRRIEDALRAVMQ
jgi:sugar phosphate isomerase/epimerase